MFYDCFDKFKYLFLVGDVFFDNWDIYELGGNFVFFYQDDSLYLVFVYFIDDFYVVFYGSSFNDLLWGDLNILVGWLFVKFNQELEGIVDKIVYYDESVSIFGDW